MSYPAVAERSLRRRSCRRSERWPHPLVPEADGSAPLRRRARRRGRCGRRRHRRRGRGSAQVIVPSQMSASRAAFPAVRHVATSRSSHSWVTRSSSAEAVTRSAPGTSANPSRSNSPTTRSTATTPERRSTRPTPGTATAAHQSPGPAEQRPCPPTSTRCSPGEPGARGSGGLIRCRFPGRALARPERDSHHSARGATRSAARER